MSIIKMIIYTDGGCHQDIGIGGWGMHGYTFTNESSKQGPGCSRAYLTDQGYIDKIEKEESIKNPITILKYIDGFGSLPFNSTNNVAELTATIKALEYIVKNKISETIMLSDSNYVVQGFNNWIENWVKNNWIRQDGTGIANKDLWLIINQLKEQLKEFNLTLTFKWIKGHSGDLGNDSADTLATYGVIVGKKKIEYQEIIETDAKGYWSKTTNVNRFIDKPRWYFNSYSTNHYNESVNKKFGDRWVYHLGRHGADDDALGMNVADSSFSVVYLKNKIEEMELIRSVQNEYNVKNFESVIIGKLDSILSSNSIELFEKYKSLLIEKNIYKNDLYIGKTLLTKEMNPPQLAFRALDKLNQLELILDLFLNGDDVKNKINVTEITDIFYGKELKGKKEVLQLKPTINSTTKKVNVKCKYITKNNQGELEIPLLLGIDTPTRNCFSALTDRNPKVFVVTWSEESEAFYYATVVKTDDDVGIWAGVYSNLKLVPSKQ